MVALKKFVRELFHRAGYDFHRLILEMNPSFQIHQGLERFGIDLVFDVGANGGQFGTDLRSMGYRGRIVSFEPLCSAHAQLVQAARGPACVGTEQAQFERRDDGVGANVAGARAPFPRIHTLGLELTVQSRFTDRRDGRTLQIDAIFFRT